MNRITFSKREKKSLPKGAKELKRIVGISVEEISNGFIISKSYDIKYMLNGQTDYLYYTEKSYSTVNPISIKDPLVKENKLDSFVNDMK